MSINKPNRGELDWDGKLNAALDALDAKETPDGAQSKAAAALSAATAYTDTKLSQLSIPSASDIAAAKTAAQTASTSAGNASTAAVASAASAASANASASAAANSAAQAITASDAMVADRVASGTLTTAAVDARVDTKTLAGVATTRTTSGALAIGIHNPVDATAGALTVTLANASGAGRNVSIEKTDSSANIVTVSLNLRGTNTTIPLTYFRETLLMESKADGSWWPVGGHRTKSSIDTQIAAWSPKATVAAVEASSAPVYILHGGNNLMAPDGTLEWYDAAMSFNLGHLDFDAYSFTGCTTDLALIHGSTVDAATTASGPVADHSPMSYRALTVDSSSWFGQGWGDTHLPTLVDIISKYGGKAIFHVELKNRPTSVTDPLPILTAMLDQYGLRASTIIHSADYQTCVDAAALGFTSGFVATAVTVASHSPAQMLADGVRWLDLQGESWLNFPTTGTGANAASDATFTSYISAGIKVVAWTLARQSEVARYLALGCKGAYIASPYASGIPALYRRTTDPFVSNRQPAGAILTNNGTAAQDDTYSTDHRGIFGSGAWQSSVVGGGNNQSGLQGWASPLANPRSFTLDVNYILDTPHSNANQGYGIELMTTDAPFFNNTTSRGYRFYFRQNGNCNLYRFQSSGTSSLGSGATWTATLTTPPILSAALTTAGAITSLPVTGASVPNAIASGTRLLVRSTGGSGGKGQIVTVSSAVLAGATSIPVNSFTPASAVASGSTCPQVIPLHLVVGASTMTLTRLDNSDPALTATDSTYSAPYLFFSKAGNGSGNIVFSARDAVIT